MRPKRVSSLICKTLIRLWSVCIPWFLCSFALLIVQSKNSWVLWKNTLDVHVSTYAMLFLTPLFTWPFSTRSTRSISIRTTRLLLLMYTLLILLRLRLTLRSVRGNLRRYLHWYGLLNRNTLQRQTSTIQHCTHFPMSFVSFQLVNLLSKLWKTWTKTKPVDMVLEVWR